MKAPLLVLAGVYLGLGTSLPAQEMHILRGDEAAVAVAVVEWWGPKATELAQKQGTLVISKRAFTRTVGSAMRGGDARQVKNPEREHFEFPSQAFQGVEKATGLRIDFCEEEWVRTSQSLCGIAEPWTWLVFSAPVIDGDNAVIGLAEGELDRGPPGTRRRINPTFFNVYLQRKGGRWVVVEVQQTAVS